ncbi:MAG: dihydrofolate reductase, partial [Parcubacteria group bacterium LiPW_72]
LNSGKNIILNRDPNYKAQDATIVGSIEEALKEAGEAQEVMICGGASVYAQFLPLAHRLYLTYVHHNFEGDTFFPEFNKEEWQEVSREDHASDTDNIYPYSFVVYEKR